MRIVIGAFLAVFAIATSCLAAEIKSEDRRTSDDVPVLGVIVEQVLHDRIACVFDAQERSKSTPTFSTLLSTNIDRNLGARINAGEAIRQTLRNLQDRADAKPELARTADLTTYISFYKACMRGKGYPQSRD